MQVIRIFNEKTQPQDKLVVLVAEEHALTAKIQKKSLEESGFAVLLAKTPAELFNQVQNQKIDLLMADVAFSKTNIANSIARIKRVSLNSQVKIVLTSIASQKIKQSLGNKIDRCLVKPIAQDKLVRELKKLFFQPTRRFERIAVDLNADIIMEEKIFYARVVDISNTGLHLADNNLKIPKSLGSILKIEIELPKYKQPILLTAVVVRKTAEGYGLKIMNISLENKKKLAKFIEKNGFGTHLETYYL